MLGAERACIVARNVRPTRAGLANSLRQVLAPPSRDPHKNGQFHIVPVRFDFLVLSRIRSGQLLQ